MPPSSKTRTLLFMACCNVSFGILTVLFWECVGGEQFAGRVKMRQDGLQTLSK